MGRFSRLDRKSLTRQYFLDFTTKLNFGYLNVEGLSLLKRQVCCSLIDAGIFDILILSETWFPKTFNYMSYPYSFVQSQFNVKRINTRQSGGLLVMCSIQSRSLISSFQTSVDGI